MVVKQRTTTRQQPFVFERRRISAAAAYPWRRHARRGVYQPTMRDVDQATGEESPYECFECGTVVTTGDHPGQCPTCGGEVRNRQTPLE
jgi:rubrerythrin